MARPKGHTYPSDHRRWFRVMEDILEDPKLTETSADVFRFYFRLLAMLNRTKSRDGKITLGRHALNACALRERHGAALALARCGAGAGLYTLSSEGETVVIQVPKWSEIQQFAPTSPQRHPSKTPPPTPTPKTTPKRARKRTGKQQPDLLDGSDASPPSPNDYGDGVALRRKFALQARATAEERDAFFDANWGEIQATARVECEDPSKLPNQIERYAFRKWNAYLRERDPTRRQYAREARARSTIAARQALEAELEARDPPPSEPPDPDDDPLAMLVAGDNPYARQN